MTVVFSGIFAEYSRKERSPEQKEEKMVSHVDELTIDYTEDGVLVVKELDKAVLTRGAWSTVVFKYQEWNRQKEDYGPVRFTIRRYRKRNDEYRQQSKFNISSADQAKQLVEILRNWTSGAEEG